MFAHVGRRVGQRLPAVVKATTKTRTFEFSVRNLATYKQSTGLVGLDVDDNGNVTLKEMSLKVLEKAEILPDCYYKKQLGKIYGYFIKVCDSTDCIKTIEDELEMGQIEEVIEACKDEIELIEEYHENKVWEMVEKAQAEAEEMVERAADSIFFTCPEQDPRNKMD